MCNFLLNFNLILSEAPLQPQGTESSESSEHTEHGEYTEHTEHGEYTEHTEYTESMFPLIPCFHAICIYKKF